MTALASARRRIQQLGPYQSLALMLLPIVLVEPLKIVALFVAGGGHWLTGTGIMIAAYAVSLVFVERLFKVVKSRLMTMNWFANMWTRFTAMRDTTWRRLRALSAKRLRPSPRRTAFQSGVGRAVARQPHNQTMDVISASSVPAVMTSPTAFPSIANLERQSRVPSPARPGKPALAGNPNSRRRFFSPGGLDAASDLKLVTFFHAPDRVILSRPVAIALAPPLSGPTAAPPSPTNRLNAD